MQRKNLLLILSVIMITQSFAQNINSPYSVYGIGDIDFRYNDKSSGMGHTSLALLSTPGFSFNKNPASLAGYERSVFQADLSLVGKTVTYAGNPVNSLYNTSRDMAIKRFSAGIKLNKTWSSSVGLMPYSYVNYQFTASKNIEGSTTNYDALYEGDGGIYNVYWTNAFSLGKHFSVGIRSNFLTGSINQAETLQGQSLDVGILSKTRNYYNNLRFEYGAIYTGALNKNLKLSLGGKFSTKTKLLSERTLTVTEGASVVEQDRPLNSTPFWLPASYSFGIALASKERSIYTLDYTFENWDALHTKGNSWSLINSHRLSAGVQFTKKVEVFGRILEKSFFQAGVFTNQYYMQIHGTPVTEYGATLGYGGLLRANLAYSLSLEAGRRGTTINGLVKESYIQFTIALSYREFLFSKGRKYN